MKNRIAGLIERLPEDVDAVLITSSINRFYFTGMHSSAGTILVTKDAGYFIVDFRYIELAKNSIKNCEVILQDDLNAQLRDLLKKHDAKKVAVETAAISVYEYNVFVRNLEGFQLLSDDRISKIIEELRCHKDEAELACIKAAQRITDDGFQHILNFIKPGVTERRIALELENSMKLRGADDLSFDIICVSGIKSSMPHGVPGDKRIAAGDFVTLDFGVMVGGYCSDMTRTVAVGHATEEMQKVYDTVLCAQLAALNAIKVGVSCFDIDKAARDIIYGAGYEGCFGHGTGHSLGLEIHEDPRFSTLSKAVCQPGMVMTVEPGIYLEGQFGCRVEDMVFIGQTSTENLTHSPKDLIIL
ncbi:MAG: Xaa-Pro peptidase family protein [Angelakisella sp.]|nr:Xaa-Pro peptidase family protein [Angelakisella sp.]